MGLFSDKDGKNNRFVPILEEHNGGTNTQNFTVFVDRVTGVNYLFTHGVGGVSGLCPLYDENGKIVVSELK